MTSTITALAEQLGSLGIPHATNADSGGEEAFIPLPDGDTLCVTPADAGGYDWQVLDPDAQEVDAGSWPGVSPVEAAELVIAHGSED